MEYAAYPMPRACPDYPSHWQIAAYFDDFVDHFGLRERITFRTEVAQGRRRAEPAAGTTSRSGRWTTAAVAETRHYDHVLVANGHHWDPRWPEPGFPGSETFPGVQIHAHYYRTPGRVRGQARGGARDRQLGHRHRGGVVPGGAARPTSRCAAARTSLPKYLFGMPTDHLTDSPLARGPLRLQKLAMRTMLRLAVGKMTDYGLPEPDHDVLEAHPTSATTCSPGSGHGDITVKPNIDRFEGSKVFFTDGTRGRGRRRRLLHRLQGQLPVPRRVDRRAPRTTTSTSTAGSSPPDHPGLYFIGLVQPLGAIMPLAEAAGALGRRPDHRRRHLPPRGRDAGADRGVRRGPAQAVRRLKRHTIQVDVHSYRAELERERRTRAAPDAESAQFALVRRRVGAVCPACAAESAQFAVSPAG